MKLSVRSRFIALWLLWGTIAALACTVFWKASHLNGEYLPVTNDAFYHARRILDTAADPASFYEFDRRIHAPEGSLLCWPWGYDYALGWLVRIAGAIGIPGPPIAFLIWVPVIAVFASVGLIMLIARRLGLSLWSASVAALCVALLPLTATLHGIGMVDHHFAEYIFVLATLAAGLKFFANPRSKRAAAVLGVTLGIAPAVHNGLFILQIPILATLLLHWLQNIRLPGRTAWAFSLALLAASAAALAPSLPVRLGLFQFYSLSWFHLYVAAGTVAFTLLLSRLPRTTRSCLVLAAVGALLLVPLVKQILLAHSFLEGNIARLDGIIEMKSPLRMTNRPGGLIVVTSFYSLLLWLTPLIAAYCAFSAWSERNSPRLFFWICSLLGLTLLLMQFRLNYFGSFALFLPLLVLAERWTARYEPQAVRPRQIKFAVSLGFLLAFALPLRYFLFGAPPAPAADPNFVYLRPVLEVLKKQCARSPGVVLADNDAGHYIRYYTDCSVIANNFLLTPQHEAKIAEIDRLTALTAEQLSASAPYVRYVLLRPASLSRTAQEKITFMSYSPKSAPLIDQLLLGTRGVVPANYVLLQKMDIDIQRPGETEREVIPVIRLYEIQAMAKAAMKGGPVRRNLTPTSDTLRH